MYMSEENLNAPENDEAELDAALAASIEKVKAGQTIAPQAQGQSGESAPTVPTGEATPTGEAGPTGGTGSTGEGDSNPQPTGATGEEEFRIPQKGKYETDDAYETRVELFDLVKRRKAATTPEAKAALSEEIKKAKGNLRQLGKSESSINQPKADGVPTGASGEADPNLEADKERLKSLGGATKEDVAEIIRQERLDQEVKSDLQKFVKSKPELKDEDVRDVFFDFVDANYNWQDKSGKELRALLSMAHDAMFRPADTVQERVLKAAGVAEKVNAMQFPGGTGGQLTFSPEMKQSIDEMKAAGMSEEKAIELLSE
jgi:hypothetical protein